MFFTFLHYTIFTFTLENQLLSLTCVSSFSFSLFKDFTYLFMRDTERETQAEGEAGSMQGARRGTRFRVSRSCPGLQAALNCCATGAARSPPFWGALYYHKVNFALLLIKRRLGPCEPIDRDHVNTEGENNHLQAYRKKPQKKANPANTLISLVKPFCLGTLLWQPQQTISKQHIQLCLFVSGTD